MITSETHDRTVIRIHAERPLTIRCEECDMTVEAVSLEIAAGILNVGTRELLRLITERVLHEFETENKIMVVCGKSIERLANDRTG